MAQFVDMVFLLEDKEQGPMADGAADAMAKSRWDALAKTNGAMRSNLRVVGGQLEFSATFPDKRMAERCQRMLVNFFQDNGGADAHVQGLIS